MTTKWTRENWTLFKTDEDIEVIDTADITVDISDETGILSILDNIKRKAQTMEQYKQTDYVVLQMIMKFEDNYRAIVDFVNSKSSSTDEVENKIREAFKEVWNQDHNAINRKTIGVDISFGEIEDMVIEKLND